MILSHMQSGKRPRSNEAQHSVSGQGVQVSDILVRQHLKAKVNLTTIVSSNEVLVLSSSST